LRTTLARIALVGLNVAIWSITVWVLLRYVTTK